ncbi:uncharacterized protein LOC108626198 [Ceratina calcarata]|uniref:Uncharacterized protein LOC108626198 n=1 Tax=Ceratina calcarata TaxID=156304 RepID=A0AAJ7J231_9HYME|nr:uncharacterized protein LOC108626198 [Ceratina calcarata]
MVFIADDIKCKREKLSKPKSILRNGKFYQQPERQRPIVYVRPYQKPTQKIESYTTYGLSYTKFDSTPRMRVSFGKYEKMLAQKPGKIDFDTVYKFSYQPATGHLRKPFIPKENLAIHGVHDMATTQKLSYMNPGYVKTKSYAPYRGRTELPIPMEYKTVMKESYQDFGKHIEVKRPRKREFWQTKFKTDYQTTSKLSYQYVEPLRKRIRVPYKPTVRAKIENETVYSTSYQVPGNFVIEDISVT